MTGLTSSAVSPFTVDLNWTGLTTASDIGYATLSGYYIYYDNATLGTTYYYLNSTTANSLTINSLLPLTTYKFMVAG